MNANRNKTTHNILEKNRRAHLKECFENLQNELPLYKDKKVTNLLILKQTCKYLEVQKIFLCLKILRPVLIFKPIVEKSPKYYHLIRTGHETL